MKYNEFSIKINFYTIYKTTLRPKSNYLNSGHVIVEWVIKQADYIRYSSN